MSPRLRILRGARAGAEVPPSGRRLLVGRDLGSRNGTFVNGVRAEGAVRLEPGDVIRFGGRGPEARFEMEGSVTARVRARTAVATRRLRWITVVLFVLTPGAAVALLLAHRDRLSWERERDLLRATVDSLLQQEDRSAAELEGEVEALLAALEQSRAEVEAIRDELARREGTGGGSSEDVAALQRELEEADGQVVSGTGFSVRDDALLVTARHLLEGPAGRVEPERIAVQFSDSEQVWPARLIATSDTEDLALLRADNIRGAVPTVRGLNARPDTVQSASPAPAEAPCSTPGARSSPSCRRGAGGHGAGSSWRFPRTGCVRCSPPREPATASAEGEAPQLSGSCRRASSASTIWGKSLTMR